MVNQARLIALTQKLIRANSENPPGNESVVAEIVKKELEECGFEVKTYEFAKNRTNVVGILKRSFKSFPSRDGMILKGKNSAKSLLLTPHLDTVPAGENSSRSLRSLEAFEASPPSKWKHPPFAAEIIDGKIYGRGAADCKCNVAVCLEVAHQLKEKGIKLDYDLVIAATADEEKGSKLGLIPLLEKGILKPTHALVADVEGFKIAIMQKGVLQLKAFIYGKKAHGAYPWKGENAIEKASQIITDLKSHKFKFNPHPLVHPPTINVGIIKGGEGVNIVPDECEFTIDARYLPGMNGDSVALQIKKIIEKTTKKYKLETLNMQLPYELDRNNALIVSLESALKKNKIAPKVEGSEGATVMTFFQKYNIPAISFGVGPDMAHQTDEYVAIDDLVKGAEVLLTFLKEF